MEKVDSQQNPLDAVKWVLGILILAAAVWMNYSYSAFPLLYRVLGSLVAVGIALWVLSVTSSGGRFLALLRGARTEMKKVVWPSGDETKRVTGLVLIITLVMAMILGAVDFIVGFLISLIIG